MRAVILSARMVMLTVSGKLKLCDLLTDAALLTCRDAQRVNPTKTATQAAGPPPPKPAPLTVTLGADGLVSAISILA